jgi:hypothetical protein
MKEYVEVNFDDECPDGIDDSTLWTKEFGHNNGDTLGIPLDWYLTETDREFHIGERNNGSRVNAVEQCCAKCGGDTFKLALSSYYTAVSCVNCGWELAIHRG